MEVACDPTDSLDHATPDFGAGSKIGFDATAKWPEEGKVRVWPKELAMDAATKDLVERRWREYGL
jgi:4-hydroxy-3-polyprenylbenzoate decarboxylase